MKAVCAWCQIDLGDRPGEADKITHGICEPCKSKMLEDITKPEPPKELERAA